MIKQAGTKFGSQKGGALMLAAFSIVVMALMVGLTVDLGGAYVARSRLSKAVDAAALAGVKNARLNDADMRSMALKVANANYCHTRLPVTFDIQVDHPSLDATRVRVSGRTGAPTYFTKLIGENKVDIATLAEATRYPLDLSFVLDTSGSLEAQNAFDDLQDASAEFLEFFNDDTDQVGLVTYSTWAEQRMPAQKRFTSPGQTIIQSLRSHGYTNPDEALRLAKTQLDSAPPRQNVLKIAVMFTDGRPTAFRDQFVLRNIALPPIFDGVVTTGNSGPQYRGLFQWQDGRCVQRFLGGLPVLGSVSSCPSGVPEPVSLPGNLAVVGDNIRALGIQQALERADAIRAAGYTIYTVGLGNPRASDPLDQPDLPFLRRLANEGGIANSSQPRGEMLFAPSAADLDNVFAKLADRILTRLTQ